MNKLTDVKIESVIKEILAEIKKGGLGDITFTQDSNFIEELNLDSFEVVNFVDQLDQMFNIDFGSQAVDFDSLKSWPAFLANIRNKINMKSEQLNGK